MNTAAAGLLLAPESDVDVVDGRMVATSCEPWLRVVDTSIFPAGKFVEIWYRASLYDDPARPVLRFVTGDGEFDHVLPGPVMGAATWAGRAPHGVTAVLVSPTHRIGRFDFRLENVGTISAARFYARAARGVADLTASALICRLIGFWPEHDRNVGWATGFTLLENYAGWGEARIRAMEPDGIDAPRCDWERAPGFLVRVDARGASASDLEASARSLVTQSYGRWKCWIDGGPSAVNDDRFVSTRDALKCEEPAFAISLRAGDALSPSAMACVVEQHARAPTCEFVYADEECVASDGGVMPRFKPDWSPWLQAATGYVGRMCARLSADGAQALDWLVSEAIAPGPDVGFERVLHVRRLLLRRRADREPAQARRQNDVGAPGARAAIVIPTRDRVKLLRACVDSVRATTSEARDIIIVDNGSVERETLDYLRGLEDAGTAKVVASPGVFNFSRLCNEGAAASNAEVLVFLNNDTEALAPGWLELLIARALEPDIGAVGAKLLFPDRKVQHVELVLGLQGFAGTPDRGVDEHAPGWHARNLVAHECSAVTAACLAVARDKFEAVGGFDEGLAIELNDVDLCLRLAERGWVCMTDPDVQLLHREGATRGGSALQRISKHSADRARFKARWSTRMRDDPYFHPGLSLQRLGISLA